MLDALKGFIKPSIFTVLANFMEYKSQKYFSIRCPWAQALWSRHFSKNESLPQYDE